MDKELEYIDGFIAENEYNIKNLKNTGYSIEIQKQYRDYLFKQREMLNTIKQSLLELKSIKEANSNEALEDLEVINNYGCGINDNMKISEVFEKEYTTIKQSLTTKSKKEQAFDIANKKCVDMYRLRVADNVEKYNKWTEFDEYWLTEEEYEILKEVL